MHTAERTQKSPEADQEIRVPLDMESVFGWCTWLLIGLVTTFLTLPLVLVAISEKKPIMAIVFGTLMLLGFLAFRKMIHQLTKSMVISSEGICWRRGLFTRQLEWKDVRFYYYGLMDRKLPHHARFEVRSHTGRVYFETRIVWYEDIRTYIQQSCPQAFSMDYTTGRIYPPMKNDMANFMRAEFESIARRQARRFRLLSIAQILGLPLFAILTVAVMAGPIFVIGWKVFPYGLADITANFRRARAAWQSYLDDGRMKPGTIAMGDN